MDKLLHDPPVLWNIHNGYPFGDIPALGAHDIHLWTVPCQDLDAEAGMLSGLLSREERLTAAQFRKTTDARDYALRRGYLRLVLGHYLGTEPSLIPLVTGKYGKPGLGNQSDHAPLSFSISRSREMVALAVAGHFPVGIDIVQPDARYPFLDAAEYLFSPAEMEFVGKGPADLQFRHFFQVWAIKEALLKAQGGTALMMRDVEVSGMAGQIFGDVRSPSCFCSSGQRFYLWGVSPDDGHYCAIAAGISE